jgi:hypothetical protein
MKSALLSKVFIFIFIAISSLLFMPSAQADVANAYLNKTYAAFGSEIVLYGTGFESADRITITDSPSPTFRYSVSDFRVINSTEIHITLPLLNQLPPSASADTWYYINANSTSGPDSNFLDINLFDPMPFDGTSGRVACSGGGYVTISASVANSQTACAGVLTLPSGVTEIQNALFYFYPNLTAVNLPSTLTLIGDQAFQSATNLSQVNFSEGLSTIGSLAFAATTSLTSIEIPNSVTLIGSSAFEGSGLTEVEINGPNVTLGSGSFQQMGQLRSVVIGSGVTSIPDQAFYNNYADMLQNITLSNSVTSIGSAAFLGAAITTLVIPDSVISIDGRAFEQNVHLTTVEMGRNVASMGSGIFSSTNLSDPDAKVFYCGASTIPRDYAYDSYPSGPSCSVPSSPTIGTATALSPTTAAVSFTAPNVMGGQNASSYNVSVWDENLLTLIKTQTFNSGLPSRGQPTTFTVTGLTKSSAYKFKVAAVNAQGPSIDSAATNLVTTAAGTTIPGAPTITQVTAGDRSLSVNFTGGSSGGGTISIYKYSLNGGSFIAFGLSNPIAINNLAGYQNYSVRLIATNEIGDSVPSNAVSSITLDFAQDKARKDANDLSEILSLVPSIAGLSQSIAGLGNSLLLPQKCVKGKKVKTVKAGAKCPKGYKVKK